MASGVNNQPHVDNGSTNTPLNLDEPNLALHMTLAAFTGIAWYNVIELNIAVYMTFKRKRGLYFWSVFACIWGIALHSTAFILKLYGIVRAYQVTCTLITIGWYAMVTGQSLVLYSRLHLVVHEPRLIRGVLAMIVFNAVAMHLPTTVLTYGSNSPDWRRFSEGFRVMEKIQMTMFCVQELAISGIYIWATLQFLRPAYRRSIRSVMVQLLWINVAIIAMDLAMLTMEYLNKYFLEAVMKGAIYSVKLKLEFAVLNQLMQLANSSRRRDLVHDDSRKPYLDTTGGGGSGAGRGGVASFLRRLIPRPRSDAVDEPNNYFISPSILQSTGSTRHRHLQQRSVTGWHDRHGSRGGHPEPPEHGIAMTTEIRQRISTPHGTQEHSCDDLDRAAFYHGESRPGNRLGNTSLTMVGTSMESGKSGQSQLELVDYASVSSDEAVVTTPFQGGLTAPPPVAQPRI